MIDLSIVIVTWNTRELVLACLRSIERHLPPRPKGALDAEVVVVDNGSIDGSAEAIRVDHPGVEVVELASNSGFAAGCNAGLRRTSGRHRLLLNSDCELQAGAAEYCVAYLDAHADVGVVGPRLMAPDGSPQHAVHGDPRLIAEIVPKSVLAWWFPERFPTGRSLPALPRDVDAVLGAALFVRASVLEEVGGFDEDYFFFLEETDLCRRIRRAGWRVVHLPGAAATHVLGASSKKKSPALTRIEYHRSLYRFYRKHRGRRGMTAVIALRAAKCVLYVSTQAPLALLGGRHRARWRTHCRVALWHLRGCPEGVGIAQLGAESTTCSESTPRS